MAEEVAKLISSLSGSGPALLSIAQASGSAAERDSKAQSILAANTEACKALQSLADDVSVLVRADDPDQRAILDILKDCMSALDTTVRQMGVFARNIILGKGDANTLNQLKESIQQIEDAGRGLLETYHALAVSEFGGNLKAKQTVPVTVITGFLGSGKTTLLNYILTKNHGKRIAVIENEYGEIGIDDLLIKDKFSENEEIFLMNNGCICCTVRGDLIKTLGSLMAQKDKFDYILLETTGLADPAPIAQTFFTVPEIGSKLRMDGIITVVDSKHLLMHIDEKKPDGAVNESVEQIAFADRILLNKTDLVTPDELESIKRRIRGINKVAEIIPTQRSVIDLDRILNIRAFDLEKIMDVDPDFLLAKEEDESCDLDHCEADCKVEHAHHHQHHDHDHKEKKHKDGDHDHKKEKKHKEGREKHEDSTGDYVPKLGKGKHEHDDNVKSIGLSIKGDLDMEKLNGWMGKLLREQGANIYRMKGVLSVRGMESRFVFQGVHMIFDGNPGSAWRADETRQNKIVFIGKKLDREVLEQGLRACLA